jgi:hypothetical protein
MIVHEGIKMAHSLGVKVDCYKIEKKVTTNLPTRIPDYTDPFNIVFWEYCP